MTQKQVLKQKLWIFKIQQQFQDFLTKISVQKKFWPKLKQLQAVNHNGLFTTIKLDILNKLPELESPENDFYRISYVFSK